MGLPSDEHVYIVYTAFLLKDQRVKPFTRCCDAQKVSQAS